MIVQKQFRRLLFTYRKTGGVLLDIRLFVLICIAQKILQSFQIQDIGQQHQACSLSPWVNPPGSLFCHHANTIWRISPILGTSFDFQQQAIQNRRQEFSHTESLGKRSFTALLYWNRFKRRIGRRSLTLFAVAFRSNPLSATSKSSLSACVN